MENLLQSSKANGEIDIEVALLEKEIEMNARDIEIYFRLSILYSLKRNYTLAFETLKKAEKLIVLIEN
jgi:hypothetical protein